MTSWQGKAALALRLVRRQVALTLLRNDLVVARAFDNRIGTFAVLEALRRALPDSTLEVLIPDFGGDPDGQLDILPVDVRPAQGSVRLQTRYLHPGLVASLLDAPGIVEHRNGMKIAGFAHQFPAEVDHGLEILVAHLGRRLDSPLERLVRTAGELGVKSDVNVGHSILRLV